MAHREIPYFVDDEKDLELWEHDGYLIDRKRLFGLILRSNHNEHNLLFLLNSSKATVNNFARLVNELISVYGAKDINENAIECSSKVKQEIFKRRKEIFYPKLHKAWKKIPTDFLKE